MRRAVLIVCALTALVPACRSNAGLPPVVVTFHTSSGNVIIADYSLANTQEERTQGLMGVRSLGKYGGEVFLFDGPQSTGGFWMKDTVIPLSIVFWGPDGTIYAAFDMQPCTSDTCKVYAPGGAYVGAIEMNQGAFARLGIKIGDTVTVKVNDG